MATSTSVRVQGLDELERELLALPGKLRRRALANALRAGARIVRDQGRTIAPVLGSDSPMVRRGFRTPGLLRRSIVVRTSKAAKRAGDVGVFVNVRPAKVGTRGARSPLDPFYWRWVAPFGDAGGKAGAGLRLLRRAATKLPEALVSFERTLGPVIAKLNRPKAPAP